MPRRLFIFVFASACTFVLFSVQPVRLVGSLSTYATAPERSKLTSEALDLIKTEHQKAIDEIKLRIEIEDNWYHYKFLLVGGLALFVLGFPTVGPMLGIAPSTSRELLSCTVWAVACVIALAIDIHV